jgi:hypothetical protein
MIRLDLKRKIAMIDQITSLDQVIMFISANQKDLFDWRIVPYDQVVPEKKENTEEEERPDNISDYF